MKSFLFKCRNS